MKIPRTLVAALTLSAVVATSRPTDGQEARTAGDFGAMGTAKVMCSAVFVSGRDLDEALRTAPGRHSSRRAELSKPCKRGRPGRVERPSTSTMSARRST